MSDQSNRSTYFMGFYRRNLPHYQPGEADYFITFRLAGSLPEQAVEQLNIKREQLERSTENLTYKQRNIFAYYEKLLDNRTKGPLWLSQEKVSKVVTEALHYRDHKVYDLHAFCIMPNHVHIVFRLLPLDKEEQARGKYPVTNVLRGLKRYTAVKCNKILNREGQFWQHESFDRVIRDNAELKRTIKYVIYNPVKAGLIDYWENWLYSYCKPKFIGQFRYKK